MSVKLQGKISLRLPFFKIFCLPINLSTPKRAWRVRQALPFNQVLRPIIYFSAFLASASYLAFASFAALLNNSSALSGFVRASLL